MKQIHPNIVMGRRKFSKQSLLVAAVLGTSALPFGSVATAAAQTAFPNQGFKMLINALKSIGKEPTLALAQKLEATQTNNASFSLHLRSANLDASDADILAKALDSMGAGNMSKVSSFSVSYNPLLGDEGIIALANSLPQSIDEIGLVGCNMGDLGAKALLTWAKQAPNLKMLCIEGNTLSPAMKQSFMDLKQHNSGLLIVV